MSSFAYNLLDQHLNELVYKFKLIKEKKNHNIGSDITSSLIFTMLI